MDNYQIIDGLEGHDLKSKENARFIMTIDYNLASVYQLSDSSYLVMPINPFAKCLRVQNKAVLEKWIDESYFPTNEVENQFYFENKHKMDSLPQYKNQLKEILLEYIYKGPAEITCYEIDSIYKLLKQRKRFKEYKLNFVVLLGDFLIQKYPQENYRWGLFESRQLLNPVVSLILVRENNGNQEYFKIQDRMEGKYGFTGTRRVENSIQRFWLLPNEIEMIKKVM
jgi:hypothetical protein